MFDSPTATVGTTLYDPRSNKNILNCSLTLKQDDVDDLQVTVAQTSALFGTAIPFKTHTEVWQDNKVIFRGRVIDITKSMKDSGMFTQTIIFESVQNYLKDSIQRYWKVQDTTILRFLQQIITVHNNQVPEYKQFTVRKVDVTNSTDNVYRYIGYDNTWATIKDKLIGRLGGHIKIEHINGINYLDYLAEPGVEHKQDTPIQISKNLQSAEVKIDPTEIITRLVPLGATIEENEEETETDVSMPRIDIKSVYGGQDYIDIPDLQKEFGIINGTRIWEDVHKPDILYSKAREWIKTQTAAKETYAINALELQNNSFDSFNVSDRYLFVNPKVASKQFLQVIEKKIDFSQPQKSSLTIADKDMKLSDYQNENKNAAKEVNRLDAQTRYQRSKIVGLNKQNQAMQKTIENQKQLVDKLQTDVDNADLEGIGNKLDGLSKNINDLGEQVGDLNYVTPEQFSSYQTEQSNTNADFEKRLQQLEGGTVDGEQSNK